MFGKKGGEREGVRKRWRKIGQKKTKMEENKCEEDVENRGEEVKRRHGR